MSESNLQWFCMAFIRTLAALVILVNSLPLRAELWPFDQRQVLLVQIEGAGFPDALTTAQVLDVFVERGRVRWITQKGGPGDLTPIQVPADFQWSRVDSVKSLGLRYKADGIVVLVGRDAQVDLRWYAVSDGQPLYFETLYLPSSSGSAEQDVERKRRLRAWLGEMWDRIPGQGFVVNRDIANLEIEGALNEGLRVGDRITLLRLKEVKRHPVLKTLVSFESAQTGTAVVSALGRPFSKAKMDYESDLDPVRTGDRYFLKPREEKPVVPQQASAPQPTNDLLGFGDAKIFEISPRLGVGSLAYEERVGTDVYKLRSLSFSVGFRADMHLTSAWYAGFQFDQGSAGFSSPPAAYGATDLSSGWSYSRFLSGYRMPLADYAGASDTELHFMGGYSRFGFKAENLTAAVAPSAKTYSGLDFGMAIHVPIQNTWVAEVGFTRGLGVFLKEEALTSGASSSNTAWNFWTKFRIKATETSEFGGAFEVHQGSSTFEGAGTRSTAALSSKVSSQRSAFYYKHFF